MAGAVVDCALGLRGRGWIHSRRPLSARLTRTLPEALSGRVPEIVGAPPAATAHFHRAEACCGIPRLLHVSADVSEFF